LKKEHFCRVGHKLKLRTLSKLDQLAETIVKTAFILSENHHVIANYLNHPVADFKISNQKREEKVDVYAGRYALTELLTRLFLTIILNEA